MDLSLRADISPCERIRISFYFGNFPGALKCLLDRLFYVARANPGIFQHKIGAGVVSVRRAGAPQALHAINNYFLATDMIVPGSSYWNLAIEKMSGGVMADEKGIETMQALGRSIVMLCKQLQCIGATASVTF